MTRRRFPAKILAARLLEFAGCCAECGNKVGGVHGMIQWDHIVPLEMGGEDAIENLQPLHVGCHKAKTAEDARHIAKAKRMRQREAGIGRQARNKIPGSKGTPFKRRLTSAGPRTERRT